MALTKDNTDDRGSWLVVYTVFVLLLDAFATGLLYAIGVFVNSNAGLVFLLFFVYDMSVLALAFLITPFFDRARVRRRDTPFNVSFFKLKMFVCVCVWRLWQRRTDVTPANKSNLSKLRNNRQSSRTDTSCMGDGHNRTERPRGDDPPFYIPDPPAVTVAGS